MAEDDVEVDKDRRPIDLTGQEMSPVKKEQSPGKREKFDEDMFKPVSVNGVIRWRNVESGRLRAAEIPENGVDYDVHTNVGVRVAGNHTRGEKANALARKMRARPGASAADEHRHAAPGCQAR